MSEIIGEGEDVRSVPLPRELNNNRVFQLKDVFFAKWKQLAASLAGRQNNNDS